MKKEDHIRKYGQESYEKMLQRGREWKKAHREELMTRDRKWRETHQGERNAQSREWRETHREYVKTTSAEWYKTHPEEVKQRNQEVDRKGGKYYEKHNTWRMQGIPHDRDLVRMKHRRKWRSYKQIIAPETQLHHQWLPDTANYRGVALVEKNQHMHGFIDVIQILEGEITLLTETEVRTGGIK